ncbi:MAG: DNA-binding response regulator, OmpR family, contains REC and winged-helix (WHTH) domain [Sporanaerobacter sp.]|jgi:DNA-binding response OmpR family regulator|uniref:response regulator transcription factor n=1 Tax=Sporanaerobacter sp. TaxID=2010183 RepID=UPI003A0FE700
MVNENDSRILIVEDDTNINNYIFESLSVNNYNCKQAFSGTEALLYLGKYDFDIILLDLMLPGISGEQLISEIKNLTDSSIIVISAKDELESKVDVLMLGADDYLTKPFKIEELKARMFVQLRNKNKKVNNKLMKYKNLTLDKSLHKVMIENHEVDLTPQEFKILELLLSFPNRVFSKQDIYDFAWDEYFEGEDKTVNVHISNIRKKFKEYSDEEYIETVWGIGFRLSK